MAAFAALLFADDAAHYFVPEFRLSLNVGPHCSPGYLRDAVRIRELYLSGLADSHLLVFSMSVLDQANNPCRLVLHNDALDVSSCAYPYSTVLDGIFCWVQSYRLSFPLHGLMVSRYRGESASPLHQGDRNCTYTDFKFQRPLRLCP